LTTTLSLHDRRLKRRTTPQDYADLADTKPRPTSEFTTNIGIIRESA
jgi:hypothetical protein